MPCADCQVGAKTCVTADVGNSCVSFFPPLQDCQVKAKKLKKKMPKIEQKRQTNLIRNTEQQLRAQN